MSENKDPISEFFGFFDALFGACMGEDRKPERKNIESQNGRNDSRNDTLQQGRGRKSNDLWGNLGHAFIPNEREISTTRADFQQVADG